MVCASHAHFPIVSHGSDFGILPSIVDLVIRESLLGIVAICPEQATHGKVLWKWSHIVLDWQGEVGALERVEEPDLKADYL